MDFAHSVLVILVIDIKSQIHAISLSSDTLTGHIK